MKITREENRFLNRLLAAICRVSKAEIQKEIYRPGGPHKEELAAMRRQRQLARALIGKLDTDLE